MKKAFLALAFTIATVLSFATPTSAFASSAPVSATSAAQVVNPFENIPVFDGLTQVGEIDIIKFVVQKGQLLAQASVTNLLTGITRTVFFPITSITGSCTILTLDLGPLFLDVLGLQVDLSAINLIITAQSGQGNLLGNLLCAVANLLNPNPSGLLTQIAGLLNQILGAL